MIRPLRRARANLVVLAVLVSGACGEGTSSVPGAARVVLNTFGLDVDADGYNVRVDARPPIASPSTSVLILANLTPGPHTVTLDGVDNNCSVDGGNDRSIVVVGSDSVDVVFVVTCTASFRAVSVGYLYACGVTVRDAAYCWGYNGYGQLGEGTGGVAGSNIPLPVAGGHKFATVSAGLRHTCALTTAGAAYCWGWNAGGQLGNGTRSDRAGPVPVAGGLTFASVSSGAATTCGVTTSGVTYCWGSNSYGEVGDGTLIDRTSPVLVSGGMHFTTVSAGYGHTCGVTDAGAGFCWGDNTHGELGDSTTTQHTSPTAVTGGITFATVSAGGGHSCGLTTSGAAYCWGWNDVGPLGDGTTTDQPSPVAVMGALTFAQVSAGGGHSCGITTAAASYCWGWNYAGQLGDGTRADRLGPVALIGGLGFAVLIAGSGGYHSCGITTEDALYCWGDNSYGELGDGGATTPYSTVPVKVVGQP